MKMQTQRETLLRKTLLALAFLLPLAAPVTASAHTWYVENAQKASCDLLTQGGGLTSPNDAITSIRGEGYVPAVTINKDDNGAVTSVNVTFTGDNGQGVELSFFTSRNNCKVQLQTDIQSGEVTPPSQLN